MKHSTTIAYANATAAASTIVARPVATSAITRTGTDSSHFAAHPARSAS